MTFRLVHSTLTCSHTHTLTFNLKHTHTLCENTQSKVQNQKGTLTCDLISRIVATYCKTLFYPFNISRHYPFTEQNIYFCLFFFFFMELLVFKFSQGASMPKLTVFSRKQRQDTRQLRFL